LSKNKIVVSKVDLLQLREDDNLI